MRGEGSCCVVAVGSGVGEPDHMAVLPVGVSLRIPQWGRVVESRITCTERSEEPCHGAAMGPARGEPDHGSELDHLTREEQAAMGPARGEPDHRIAVLAARSVQTPQGRLLAESGPLSAGGAL